ncbi:MAG TPA: glycosyl hydrolase [Casimicrobiaceae bacterium]|nr:glycosyl hydrolase [Casimicrobiaceae bacterium]
MTAAVSPSVHERFTGALDLLARKVAEDERVLGIEFPHVTAPDGRWQTYPASWSAGYTGSAWSHGHWTCGFWVGLLIAAHLHTGDARYLVWARERMRLVAQRADDPNTHDIGFIFDGSAIPAYHVTGDTWYADIALRTAERLRARLIPTHSGAYLSSWGPVTDERARTSSAIDTMANLPLLVWAAQYSGDGSFLYAAQAHASKTAEAFIRPDDSTYHAVQYSLPTGQRVRGYTFQGYGDDSLWSRGQAWAIYGYTALARATQYAPFAELAQRLAGRYWERLGGRLIPPWDFDAPDADTVEDSAAAAIVASALLDLAEIGRPAAQHWRARAIEMLDALCGRYLARDPRHRGLLMHGCYSKPHNEGVDSATMFGDFYFVEALCKVVMPGRFRPEGA